MTAKEKGNDVTPNDGVANNNSTNAAEVVSPRFGKPLQRPNPTAGKLRAQERAEASHERLADPPGGIPGAGVGRRKGGNSGGLACCKVTTAPLFEFCLKFNI